MKCEFLKYLIFFFFWGLKYLNFFQKKLRKKFRVLTPYNFNIFTEK